MHTHTFNFREKISLKWQKVQPRVSDVWVAK